MRSRQELFDIVVIGARKQRERCVDPLDEETCLYRNRNGLKCFIGMLISDEDYKKIFDEDCISLNIVLDQIEEFKLINIQDSYFLEKLQEIHDQNPVEKWEEKFKRFAQTWKLKITSQGEKL